MMCLWASYKEKIWFFLFASFSFKSMKKEAGSAPKCPGSPTLVFSSLKIVRYIGGALALFMSSMYARDYWHAWLNVAGRCRSTVLLCFKAEDFSWKSVERTSYGHWGMAMSNRIPIRAVFWFYVWGMLGNKCAGQHNLKTVKVREIMWKWNIQQIPLCT